MTSSWTHGAKGLEQGTSANCGVVQAAGWNDVPSLVAMRKTAT